MNSDHGNTLDQYPPSPWFVLCQFLGICLQLVLALVGIATIVDRIMPGRTLVTELLVGAVACVWGFSMHRLGLLSKPRRPKTGARMVLFVSLFVCYSTVLALLDWWERAPLPNIESRVAGIGLSAFFFAGIMSLSEKGVWLDESRGREPGNQAPPRTV